MEMYKAIKEIENDLLRRSYIKDPKDINLHLNSRFDQYGLDFDSELQESDVKRRIIREVINNRKVAEIRKKIKSNNENRDIDNKDKKNTSKNTKRKKCKSKTGKKILIVDFNTFKKKTFISHAEAAKKFKIDNNKISLHMREKDIYYMNNKKLLLVKAEEGVNEIILQHIDEIVEIARDIYEKENKSKYTDKISLQEAVDLAVRIVEEREK